jgi:hypothetical protein
LSNTSTLPEVIEVTFANIYLIEQEWAGLGSFGKSTRCGASHRDQQMGCGSQHTAWATFTHGAVSVVQRDQLAALHLRRQT